MSFYKVDIKEQETIINIDYYAKEIIIYTSRKDVYKRLQNRMGDPEDKFHVKGVLCGGSWHISFSNRQLITKLLSRPLLIGNM